MMMGWPVRIDWSVEAVVWSVETAVWSEAIAWSVWPEGIAETVWSVEVEG